MDSSWKNLQIRMEAAWNMRTTPKTKRPKTGDIISSAHSLDWNKKKVRQLQQQWNDEVTKLVADRNKAISDVMVDILTLIRMDIKSASSVLISHDAAKMCADFIKEIFKTIRAYNGAAFVMTQNASDFFTMNGGEYGRAIITNADTKIIMQLPETEIEILRTAVQLTDDECNKIQQLHRGSGLVIAGSSKLFADFTASDFEAEVISGDIKKSKH
jgi:hypothetical protein